MGARKWGVGVGKIFPMFTHMKEKYICIIKSGYSVKMIVISNDSSLVEFIFYKNNFLIYCTKQSSFSIR